MLKKKEPVWINITLQLFHHEHGLVFETAVQKLVKRDIFLHRDNAVTEAVKELNNKRECVIKATSGKHVWYYQYGLTGRLISKKMDADIKLSVSPPMRNIHLYTNAMVTKGLVERQHKSFWVKQVIYWSQSYVYVVSITPDGKQRSYQVDHYRIIGSEYVKPGKLIKTYYFDEIVHLKRHMAQEFY